MSYTDTFETCAVFYGPEKDYYASSASAMKAAVTIAAASLVSFLVWELKKLKIKATSVLKLQNKFT